MNLAEKLIALRKQNNLTQMDLAEKLNVSRQAVSRWEVGSVKPNMDSLKVLSELYGVTIDYLLNDADTDYVKVEKTQAAVYADPVTKEDTKKRRTVFVYVILLMAIIIVIICGIFFSGQEEEMVTPIGDMSWDTQEYPADSFSFG